MAQNKRKLFFYYTKEELDNFARDSFKVSSMKFVGVTFNPSIGYMKDGKTIVAKEDIDYTLRQLYSDPETGYFGRDKFWSRIYENMAGIPKRDVAKFLRSNETHQKHQIPKKGAIIKPLVVTKPHAYMQVDLVDMSKLSGVNQNFNWIFTCVDLFTKYAWAFAMKTKEPSNCAVCMQQVLDDLPRTPTVVQTDSGAEFLGEFDKLLEDSDIKHLTSRAYTPTSQGAIESFNKTLKLVMNRFMTDQDSKHFLDVLPLFIKNYNNTKHSITRKFPALLHDGRATPQDISEAIDHIRDTAFWREHKNNFEPLERGEFCRLLRVRSYHYQEKPGVFAKKTVKQWSDEIYKVHDRRGAQFSLQEVYVKPAVPKKPKRVPKKKKKDDAKEDELKDRNTVRDDGLYHGEILERMVRRDHLLKIPNPIGLIESKNERGDYRARSGVNSFNVEQHNRDMGRQRAAAAANAPDDDKEEEEAPAPPRRSTRVRNAPVRYGA